METQTKLAMSPAEYIEWEMGQEHKHEYIDGAIYAKPGVIWENNAIVSNINELLILQLQGGDCRVNNSDMRLQISESQYVYADLSVHCGKPELSADRLNLLNPVLVVEALSPSSETRDFVDKSLHYFNVPSIQAYLVVAQERMHALLRERSRWEWRDRVFDSARDVIPLPMLGCELPLADIYRGVEFAES